MQTGFAQEKQLQEAHRDAMVMSAIRVFCTFAQHDVALMHAAGIVGEPKAMLANAVKHQMLHGHGAVFSEVMNKIITHHNHTPRIYKDHERNMLACVMQGYEEALDAGLRPEREKANLENS